MIATYVLLCVVVVLSFEVFLLCKKVEDLDTFFCCLNRELHATQQVVCTDREIQFLTCHIGPYPDPEECGIRRFPKVETTEIDGLSGWIVRLEPILPEADLFHDSPFDKELFNADASCAGDESNLVPNRIAICLVIDDEGTGKLRLVHASAKSIKDVEGIGEPTEH